MDAHHFIESGRSQFNVNSRKLMDSQPEAQTFARAEFSNAIALMLTQRCSVE